jgi:hypothetical protein
MTETAINPQRPLTGEELLQLIIPWDRATQLRIIDTTVYPDGRVDARVVILPRGIARVLLRDML